MQIRLAAVALLLCVPGAALAAEEVPPSPAPSEATAQPEKPKKICRMETGTGAADGADVSVTMMGAPAGRVLIRVLPLSISGDDSFGALKAPAGAVPAAFTRDYRLTVTQ